MQRIHWVFMQSADLPFTPLSLTTQILNGFCQILNDFCNSLFQSFLIFSFFSKIAFFKNCVLYFAPLLRIDFLVHEGKLLTFLSHASLFFIGLV